MTKSSKIRIALTVLALAAFTAIFFSIPALRIKRFWFAYGCGVFAILWQIYAIAVTDGKKNTADHYYGYPTARLGLYYMVLQVAASLLEIGTGFHPELTGRENIYMNGSIMGMTRAEITRKLDEIVDFAGVERYLDTPVKRYSSGMTVRLGFSVAAFMEPEILVVDEVLAVGDAEFQKKAIGKMKDVSKGEGRTVLFVSHNMASVRSLCNRGIVLKQGIIDFIGLTEEAVNHYLQVYDTHDNEKILDNVQWMKHNMTISRIVLNKTESAKSTVTSSQHTLDISIEGYTDEDIQTDLMLIIKNKDEVPMAALADGHCRGIMQPISKGNFKLERMIQLPMFMGSGDYKIDIFMHHPMVEYQLKAVNCATLHIDGYQEGFGRSLLQKSEGFTGLERI